MSDESTSPHSRTAPATAPTPDQFGTEPAVPHAARVYDYLLAGNNNHSVDRQQAQKILAAAPFVRDFARVNRAFLTRAVRYLCRQGVRQFLDIGCGFPTVEPVHEIAREVDPHATVVYVDSDALVIEVLDELLNQGVDPKRNHTDTVLADFRDPDAIWSSPAAGLLDFTQPVGLLVVALCHFLGPDDGAERLMAQHMDNLPPGSYLAASHLTMDGVPQELLPQGERLYQIYATMPTPGYFRNRDEFSQLFGGCDLIDPGLVWAPTWRPAAGEATEVPGASATLAGVAVK